MPSFLSKVFGRKKDEKGSPQSQGRGLDGSLLGGKFEAVSPTVSPSATEFPENVPRGNGKEKEKEKEGAFGIFKVKSRPSSPEGPQKKDDLPQLSLVLPVPKEDPQARALGVVFEADPEAQILTDVAIGERRLNPLEALILVRTCSQAIIARGLETLGVMHPHWYSASPDIQRRLISLFIHSLKPKNAITTLSPSSSSPTSVFESEINYTRSPHDVTAVLRWGLRHLELDGSSFGREESWYKTFAESERNSDYPPKAYSEKLPPLVPPAHLELLNATLDLFSSLAAHAEKNSTSGSKLTKTFGLWLLAGRRVEESDDWSKFYARWKEAGRMLEHLLLAKIRDEALGVRMPTRLTELVAQYPHFKGTATEDDVFLHPRLSTRQFNALFVRVETEFSTPQDKVQRHPLQFIKDAFAADVATDGNECSTVWEKIRKSGNDENGVSPGGYPGLGRVFTDETIRYLTLIPGDHPLKKATSPTFSITEITQETPSRRYASTPAESSSKAPNGTTNGHVKPATDPTPLPSVINSPVDTDWTQFSSTGFSDVSPTVAPLASTLFGQDVEKTNPPFRKPSKRSKVSSPSRSPNRKSADITVPRVSNVSQPEVPKLVSKSIPVSLVQIDEAFIEFWVDALLDPISSNWPRFVLCKLKSSLADLSIDDKHVEYLIVEHVFVPKPPPPTPAPVQPAETTEAATTPEKPSASSPKSSINKSEKRFFGLFTSSGRGSGQVSEKISAITSKGKKRVSAQDKVSEVGEVVKEEEKKPSTTVKLRIPSPKPRKSADAARKSTDAIRRSTDVARKSMEVPKEAVDKPVEKDDPNTAVPVAGAGVAAVAGAAVAVASVSAEEDQPITSSQADGTSKIAQVDEKAADEAQTSVAQVEVKAEDQPAPAGQVPAANGHTPAAAVEKPEDAAAVEKPEDAAAVEKPEDAAAVEKPEDAAVVEKPEDAPVVAAVIPSSDLKTPEEPAQPAVPAAIPVSEPEVPITTTTDDVTTHDAHEDPVASALPQETPSVQQTTALVPEEAVSTPAEEVGVTEAALGLSDESAQPPTVEERVVAVDISSEAPAPEPTTMKALAVELPAAEEHQVLVTSEPVVAAVSVEESAGPAPLEEAVPIEEHIALEESGAAQELVQEPVAAEEPATTEVPATEEPIVETVEELAATADQPASTAVETPAVEEPTSIAEEPSKEATAVVIEEPSAVANEAASAVEEPTAVEAPSVAEVTNAVEEPVAMEQIVSVEEIASDAGGTKETVAEEPVQEEPEAESAAADEHIPVEEPASTAVEEPAAAEKPVVIEEEHTHPTAFATQDVAAVGQPTAAEPDEPVTVGELEESVVEEAPAPIEEPVKESLVAEEPVAVEHAAVVVEEPTLEPTVEEEVAVSHEPPVEEPAVAIPKPVTDDGPLGSEVDIQDEVAEQPASVVETPVADAESVPAAPSIEEAPVAKASEVPIEQPLEPTPEVVAEPEIAKDTEEPSPEETPPTVEASQEEAAVPIPTAVPETEVKPVDELVAETEPVITGAEEKSTESETPADHTLAETIPTGSPTLDQIEKSAAETTETTDATHQVAEADTINNPVPASNDETPAAETESLEPTTAPATADEPAQAVEPEHATQPPTSVIEDAAEVLVTNGGATTAPAPETANGNDPHTFEKEKVDDEIPTETPTVDATHDAQPATAEAAPEAVPSESSPEVSTATTKDD